jgi:hypothetical protein
LLVSFVLKERNKERKKERKKWEETEDVCVCYVIERANFGSDLVLNSMALY